MTNLTGILPVTRFTLEVLADCAEREVRARRVYPNRILTGRMSHQFAATEIDKMAAIARLLREMAERDAAMTRPQPVQSRHRKARRSTIAAPAQVNRGQAGHIVEVEVDDPYEAGAKISAVQVDPGRSVGRPSCPRPYRSGAVRGRQGLSKAFAEAERGPRALGWTEAVDGGPRGKPSPTPS